LKTSVVIATRNSIGTIEECLSSLMPYYKTGSIGEIIVVDGASTDGTLKVIKKFPVKLMTDPGKGMFIGYEAAWKETHGELVMFIDSDACLGAGFFPGLYTQFEDVRVGIVGCLARAASKNSLERTVGQWWDYHGTMLRNSGTKPSRFKKLYYHVTGFSGGQIFTSGPCYIARRNCLEAVNGFKEWLCLYELSPRLMYPGDNLLSRSIVENGWEARWWTDAPVCHHPPSTLKSLLKQRYAWGKGDGALLRLSRKGRISRFAPPLIRLVSPVLGIWLAIRYRNVLQLVVFPLAHYAWIAGYMMAPRPRSEVKH